MAITIKNGTSSDDRVVALVSGDSTQAASNQSVLQTALSRGGAITFEDAGLYYVTSDSFKYPAGASIYLTKGVRFVVAGIESPLASLEAVVWGPGSASFTSRPLSVPPSLTHPGIPVITFNNGLSDINATYSSAGSGGSYAVDTAIAGKHAATPIRLTPGPSAANTWVTADLSATLTSNLKQFLWEHDNTLGLLCYVSEPAAIASVTIYVTVQSNRLVSRYNGTTTLVFGANARPGWYMLTVTGDRYGFTDTSGQFQQGINPDNTGGLNNIIDSTTPVDSVRLQVASTSVDTIGNSFVTLDSLWLMPRTQPTTCLIFDDGYVTQYNEGAEYLGRFGLQGTMAVTATLVGTTNFCTTAQLAQLYAEGWDLINHANTHFNANQKTTNGICLSQSGASPLLLNGSVGSAVFDAPRCITLTTAAADTGRPFTVTGLDANGAAQTAVLYGRNAGTTVSETVWTKIASITYTGSLAGAITVGTTYSYAEIFAEYGACKQYLLSNGWTRGSNLAVYPTGASNILVDQAMSDLGITAARTVSTTVRPVYPYMRGYNALQIPGYGGGGTSQAATGYAIVNKYNTGNGTCSTPTFPATGTKFVDWTVTMTAATTFEVIDADGKFVGTGSTGSALTSQGVSFTITAGATPFVAGDQWRIFVTNSLLIVEQEIVNRRGYGCLYWHTLLRSGASAATETNRNDFRMTVAQIAKDVRAGKLRHLRFSDFVATV